MEENIAKIVNLLEEIKGEINSRQYKDLYDALSNIALKQKCISYKHFIYFSIETEFNILFENGDEKCKIISSEYRTTFESENKINYNMVPMNGFENEIEYILIQNGINPFKMLTISQFDKHLRKCFTKIVSKYTYDTEVLAIENLNTKIEIMRVKPE